VSLVPFKFEGTDTLAEKRKAGDVADDRGQGYQHQTGTEKAPQLVSRHPSLLVA
jgi:hypothetical protein